MLQRERGGATALTALKLTSLSLVKEGTAQVKRCWSHVCNEGVLCCNDSALSLSSIHRPAGSATEWFYNLMIQISYLKSLYRLIPPLLMVTGDQLSQLSTGLWSRGRDVRIAITMRLSLMDVAPLMMELLMTLSSGCTVVAGGSRLGLVDYVLQTYKSVGTLAALTPSVLRPCHTSLPLLPPPSLQTWSKPQAAVSCEKPTQQSSNWNWLKS